MLESSPEDATAIGEIALLRNALRQLGEDFKRGLIDQEVMAMVRKKIVGALEQLGEDVV